MADPQNTSSRAGTSRPRSFEEPLVFGPSLGVISPRVMENRHVNREFVDEDLQDLATDPRCRPTGWSDREIADFRVLVQCARAARVDTDLRNSRMLRIEPDGAGDPTKAQATLSSGRVIALRFKNTDRDLAVVLGLATAEMENPV